MPTLEENVNRVKAAKTAIGNAITAKGGTVGANDGLEDFASDIGTIPSGGGDYNIKSIAVTGSPYTMSNNVTEVNVPEGNISIGDNAFKDYGRLTKITFPNTVTSIGASAFRGCMSLTELVIPNMTTIPNYMVYWCISLTSLIIPDTVTSIGNNAFRNCVGITQFEIPQGVTTIGGDAFRDCVGLQTIKFKPTSPPTLGNATTFYNLPTTCKIYVPTGSLTSYTSAANYPDPNTYTYEEY